MITTELQYRIVPSNKPDFKYMIAVSYKDYNGDIHNHVLCYINSVFREDKDLANFMVTAMQRSGLIPNLEI